MKKSKKIILATLGGCDVVMTVFSPIFIFTILFQLGNLTEVTAGLLAVVASFATLFRAYKIGWMK